MERLKMVLGDGSEIGIVGYALPLAVTVECASMSEMTGIWERLHTEGCMSKVQILRESPDPAEQSRSCVTHLGVETDGAQIVENGDGTLVVHFYMKDSGVPAALEDDEYAQAARILLGEEE